MQANTSTPPPRPRDNTWRDLDDEALRRYRTQYRRRLALIDDEMPEDVREDTRAYLTMLIADADHEDQQRERCVKLGIPRDLDHFPREFINDLRGAIALDALCEYHLGARLGHERGGKRQGPCPICKHGSNCFTVYLKDSADQHYICFRCGARGDCFNAMMQAWNESFPQAVERIAAECGVKLPEKPKPAHPAKKQGGGIVMHRRKDGA